MTNCDDRLRKALQQNKPARDKPFQLRLPSRLRFSCNDDLSKITIEMGSSSSKPCSTENMQTDSASFEGWSLALKSVLPEIQSISLKWDAPDKSSSSQWKHYQRFLYRVHTFQNRHSWFCALTDYNADMQVRSDAAPGFYKLNLPTQARDIAKQKKEKKQKSERDIEVELVHKPQRLKEISGSTIIGNQLPIGVFENVVARDTAIFTGQASAIDLWGANEETHTLSIFELKKPGNTKVGSVSELFFYAMVMKDLVDGRFAFGEWATIPKDVKPWPPEHINQTIKKVNAYILADRLHPLFGNGKSLFSLMNDNSSINGIPVTFGFINYRDVM